jgi:sec-independent protein translocase protein TatA
MTMPGVTEMIIILVIVLVIFGGGKLAGVGKSLGQGIKEFKSAVKTETSDEDDSDSKHTGETKTTES